MNSKSILIADDDRELVQCLAARCESLGLHVETAFDALTALNLVHEKRPHLVCLDIEMPGGNGLSVCEMLATDSRVAPIPVIIMTCHTDQETIEQCRLLSASYVAKGGDLWHHLRQTICQLLDLDAGAAPRRGGDVARPDKISAACGAGRTPAATEWIDTVFEVLADHSQALDQCHTAESPRLTDRDWQKSPPWLLCIEDDRDLSLALKLKLERHGIAVLRAFEGAQALRDAGRRLPDAILLDFHLPGLLGDEVLYRLKQNPHTRDIPVIVVTGVKDQSLQRRMLRLGAAKFLTKPLVFQDLLDELGRHIHVLPVA